MNLFGAPGAGNEEWSEALIGQYLMELGKEATRAQMVQVLIDNPGEIHSLWEYEQKYCELMGTNKFCSDGVPLRQKPPECPPEYIDDGATCRLDNIRAKPSFTGRWNSAR
ncbi:MAG: hypothetical protein IPJ40_20160 [Saprospirales bacterium]|nr:hypothetical protein [Saprospirales bacterium]